MNVDRRTARQVVAQLADRFEKRHGFDVADRAADFAQHEIVIVIAVEDEVLLISLVTCGMTWTVAPR